MAKAKRVKKKYPHRHSRLKKVSRVGGKKRRRRKAAGRKVAAKAPRKVTRKRKPVQGRKLIKQVERTSTERVLAGRKKKCRCTHRAYMAGTGRARRRSVGKSGGNMGLLLGLALGGVAVYMLTKPTTPTVQYPAGYNLPPVQQTQNYTRNSQSSDIVNYAIAAGLAVDAITSLISRLNSSSDQQVNDIYDNVNTTGNIGAWV